MTLQTRVKQAISKLAPTPSSDEKLSIQVNGKEYEVPKEYSVLDACRSVGEYIPTMCYHGRLQPLGRCGVCAVEIDGNTAYSCCVKVSPNMNITTNSAAVRTKQASALRAMKERQQSRQAPVVVEADNEFDSVMNWASKAIHSSNGAIRIDPSLCVDCGRCAAACSNLQDMSIIEIHPVEGIRPKNGVDLKDTACISCGQCSSFCPTGAIAEESHIERVLAAKAAGKIMVVQTAPAVRIALDELFNIEGCDTAPAAKTGRMVAALRASGLADYVFDSQFTADLTIIEEGYELIGRLTKKWAGEEVHLPQFTSCCPAWIKYVEQSAPQLIPYLSSAKSPMMMLGALIKTYFPTQILKVDPSKIFSVAIMPCTAKKNESERDLHASVDAVLTTRELGSILKSMKINYAALEPSEFDNPLGESSGAGVIFGNSGGVMEAALRTAYEVVSGKQLESVDLTAIRGYNGVREGAVDIPVGDSFKTVRVAICSGVKHAQALLRDPDYATKYDFIEVMSCPGGCIMGGGQPQSLEPEILKNRTQTTYNMDKKKSIRKSHENPSIKKLYDDFLEHPLSHTAHELLHTHYHDRSAKVINVNGEPVVDDSNDVVDADTVNAFIVYATQTGNSKNLAQTLADEVRSRGGVAKVAAMDKVSAADLASKQLVLLITSTFGQGEFPDMAVPMWQELNKMDSGFANVKFAVFGLGSTAYPLFCKSAELFDQRLEALGGERVVVMGKGDEKAAEGIFGGYGEFTEKLFDELGLVGDAVPSIPAPKFHVILAASAARGIPAPGYKYATLTLNHIITPDHNDKLVRQISLDISNTGLDYMTGYHCAILPRSVDSDVNEFITEVLKLDPKTVVLVKATTDSPVPGGLEHPTTLHEIFSQYIDISGRVNKNFFKALIPFAEDAEQHAKLIRLTSKEGAEELSRDYIKEGVTYIEAFREFNSCNPSLGHVISMIPPVKPRLYSIASSHKMHPTDIQLTIGKVFWETPKGKRCNGLTTHWLDHAQVGSKVAIAVKSSPLVPPKDLSVPILMACMGSGFAVMRGFLQDREVERDVNNNQVGKMVLFFGCRRRDEDWIHEDEMKKWEASGLCELSLAFSRETNKKVYITHKVDERLEDLWEYLGVQGGAFMYCGGTGVPEKLLGSIKKAFKQVGGLTDEQVEAKLVEMEHKGLLVLEAW
ncbi:hypothetical protein RCL1_006094 [Eukaryota sp. TZLM3-RCL]